MAGENHVYYFGLWDRAAHTNIQEDRNLSINAAQTFINKIA